MPIEQKFEISWGQGVGKKTILISEQEAREMYTALKRAFEPTLEHKGINYPIFPEEYFKVT